MFYGFTESESFADPTLLNNYPHHKVVIENRGDGRGFWHIVILEIKDEDVEFVIQEISKALKGDWNAMFYNEHTLYAVFKDKIFTLNRKKIWNLSDYSEVKQYAKDVDVGDLDMNKCFIHYEKLLDR